MNGTIKKIIPEKGYGFILGEDQREYFFHSSAVKNCPWEGLEEGQAVTFEAVKGGKGPRAEQVSAQ